MGPIKQTLKEIESVNKANTSVFQGLMKMFISDMLQFKMCLHVLLISIWGALFPFSAHYMFYSQQQIMKLPLLAALPSFNVFSVCLREYSLVWAGYQLKVDRTIAERKVHSV